MFSKANTHFGIIVTDTDDNEIDHDWFNYTVSNRAATDKTENWQYITIDQ